MYSKALHHQVALECKQLHSPRWHRYCSHPRARAQFSDKRSVAFSSSEHNNLA